MLTTPNLGLRKPEANDTVNIADLNYNADMLDQEVAKRIVNAGSVPSIQAGPDASKPAAGTAGRLYVATDTQAIYQDTGTAWQKVGAVKWGDIDEKPTTFPPSAHKSTHASGGSDALIPADIGAAAASDLAAHLADYVKQIPYGAATGSANTYAVTLSPAPTAYTEGMAVAIKINVDNTGASTLNVNGLGAKTIKKPNGNDVSAGNLKAGSIYTLRYNGVNFILQGEGGGGTAQPGDVLSGKTFTNDVGEQVGTMPNQGAMIITPGTTNQAILAGYHNGQGYVKGEPNLKPENIVQGKSIFGVAGSHPNHRILLVSTGMYTLDNIIGFEEGYKKDPDGNCYIDFTNNYLKLKGGDNGDEISVVTPVAIDLTNYSKLVVIGELQKVGSSDAGWIVVSSTKIASYTVYDACLSMLYPSYTIGHVLDISSFSGSYYIRIHNVNRGLVLVYGIVLY